jgi:3-methyl-2-oxobutanoate hydroxymethyltransferase
VTSPEPPVPRPRSVRDFVEMKARRRPITCLTCYDVLFARLLEEEGIDVLLVGDSLGQVVLGYDTTLPVTMDEMLHHCRAVRRGAPKTFTVLDLPFLTYQPSIEEALRNAGRALKEGGAHAVKLEGGDPDACERVAALVRAGIPVMGHLGLTPQSVHALGGYRVQGRGREAAERLGREALALEAAGCFALVLELVPGSLAEEVSKQLTIPTIGIGAGPGCDGQVLVLPDALGLNPAFSPRFLKKFADLAGETRTAVRSYMEEVRAGEYPGPEHTFEDEA